WDAATVCAGIQNCFHPTRRDQTATGRVRRRTRSAVVGSHDHWWTTVSVSRSIGLPVIGKTCADHVAMGRYCHPTHGPTSFAPRRTPAPLTIAATVATPAAAAAGAQRPVKVYISADMEGITGVASVDQLGPANFEYGQARQWMTADVLAAIQ